MEIKFGHKGASRKSLKSPSRENIKHFSIFHQYLLFFSELYLCQFVYNQSTLLYWVFNADVLSRNYTYLVNIRLKVIWFQVFLSNTNNLHTIP